MTDARSPRHLPFGSWLSPLSAQWAATGQPRLEGGALVGDEIWWGASVPEQGGRTTVRRRLANGEIDEVLPSPFNARSRVHEYGGGAWTVSPDGVLFFVNKADQRVWMRRPGDAPRALTPDADDTCFGGLSFQEGVLLAIREIDRGGATPERSIVSIEVTADARETQRVRTLAAGSDFVAQPALSPGARQLAWVAWNHPHMPWDRTLIRIATMTPSGPVTGVKDITAGATAALQPTWTADNELLYIDEITGRWNLWRRATDGMDAAEPPIAVAPADADTGGPLWVLGLRWYAHMRDGSIVAIQTHGDDRLVRIAADGSLSPLGVPARSRMVIEASDGGRVLVSGGAPGLTGMWLVGPADEVQLVVGEPMPADLAPFVPHGRAVTFAGAHGPVHAFDYSPTHPDVTGVAGEIPPYLVFVHGGPTAHVSGVADSKTMFFTSRGIGVLDVNYGGSTGYGRDYRERLRGEWGVVDVDDVVSAASGLADAGVADRRRLAIEGGSAGGWTVLGALVGSDVFAAGVSRYGVGDARALAADTADFEARYLDGLIGPLPESEALYRERSPLSHAERFTAPLLLLQGSDDAVVPPAQAEAIRAALVAHGVPHAYVLYEGEGHGFRRAETIVHALESELAFLGRVFGFETPGIDPIELT